MRKAGLIMIIILFCTLSGISQTLPSVSVTVKDSAGQKGELASTLKIALLFTLLALTPAILMMMTSFTRLIISFHFLRQAMGVQGVPPNQVIIGLSLFLTIFIMSPVALKINELAIKPYNQGKITEMEALKLSAKPIKEFMFRQTREIDLALFYQLGNMERPHNKEEVSFIVLIPAFILSELKTAFQIGFLLYIPFIIIDTIIAAILVSMGMIFLPPMMISLPFKIVMFIVADGWSLITSSLLKSFKLGGL